MNTTDILAQLREIGVRTDVVNGDLHLRGDTARLTPDLVGHIRAAKPALIALMAQHDVEPSIVPGAAGRGPHPLSSAQQRLWFLDQLTPGSALYNVPYALRITGPLDTFVLRRTLSEIVQRHEILRTRFSEVDGVPAQHVQPGGEAGWTITDLQDLPPEAREARAAALAEAEAQAPFDLAAGPLLRAHVVVIGTGDHLALFTLHHIVSDGWSVGVLIRELSLLYAAFSAGHPSPLPALPLQYIDFAAWQQRQAGGTGLKSHLRYWRQALDGVPPLLDLPLDRPRGAARDHRGASHPFAIPAELFATLGELSRHENATLFMTLNAAWTLLLSRATGQSDLCTGTPAASRTRAELEGLIGFFVNTLALRTRIDEHGSFTDLLRQTKTTVLDAFAHGQVPFEQVVDALDLARDATHAPLVQAVFLFQNFQATELDLPGLKVSSLPVEHGPARFELTLTAVQNGARLACSLAYDTDLFDAETVARLAHCFVVLLSAVAEAPGAALRDIPWIDPQERRLILAASDGGPAIAAPALSIRGLFEAQVRATPDEIAILHRGVPVSFEALNRRANGVASRLRAAGAGPDTIVGLFAERSVEMISALMGIWKAGAAYLPLDPNLPSDRLEFMLEDAGPCFVLAQPHIAHRLPGTIATVPLVDEVGDTEDPPHPAHPDPIAYVIYTSGSSGRPKAVVVTGRTLLAATMARLATTAPYRRLLLVLSLSFDGTLAGLLGTLLRGGTLVIPEEEHVADAPALARLMGQAGIDTLFSTPSLYTSLMRETEPAERAGLRQIIVAGEAWPDTIARMTAELCPDARLFNEYGPSETTIWASVAETPGDLATAPPIGHPIAGWRLHVLDRFGRLLPPGVAGELYIGGAGIARGYLGRPDLTAERFLPDAFGPPGAVLYRTGDLVRRQADGALVYLGRNDNQVKLRGFRIEIGEIEAALKAMTGVLDAAVLVDGEGEARRLMGYIVAPSLDVSKIRFRLRRQVPDYMVPARFVSLDRLPVTSNGKLDRHRLSVLGRTVPQPVSEGPRDDLERTLAAIWAEVLGIDKVGVRDDFFALGGHSLLATRVVSRVRRAWGAVPLRLIFEAPSVAAFAVRLREDVGGAATADPAPPPLGPAPAGPQLLSFAQQRLWFLDQFEPDNAFYNMSVALRVDGPLDPRVLKQSLTEIARRHAVLRTRFMLSGGAPVQVIDPSADVALRRVDLCDLHGAAGEADMLRQALDAAATPFDLARGPVIRAALLHLAEDRHVLLLTLHHIAADGWSVGILVHELTAIYRAFQAGDPSPLPELTCQYADFSHWQRTWLSGPTLKRQIAFWTAQLDGAPPLLALPVDRPRPAVQRYKGDSFDFVIPASTVDGLRRSAAVAGGTLFMALAAGYAAFLSRITGQLDLCFGIPIANRNQAETEALIGFFVNTLVLRARLEDDPSFDTLLRRMVAVTLDAYAHQDLPFELLVERLSPERQTSHTPLFQTMLALQNIPLGPLDLPDLTLSPIDLPQQVAKFDLSLYLVEAEGALRASFEFNTDLFLPATVQHLADALRTLLAGLVHEPTRSVAAVPLLDEQGLAQWRLWNGTVVPDEPLSVVELFERQVARTPEAEALLGDTETLNYAELDRRTDVLARHLQARGVGPDVLVGLCLPRSVAAVVAMLGILKAGGAYVPFDPGYPAERLAYMVADARPQLILTESAIAARTGLEAGLCLMMDREPPIESMAGAAAAAVGPANLAYVIYTSGSTGRPKGTAITHGNAAAFLAWAGRSFSSSALHRVLASTSLCFDLSVFEIFAPLCNGGAAVLVGDVLDLLSGPLRHSVTLINTVPSAIAALDRSGALPPSVRVVNLAGEALSNALVQSLYRHEGLEQVFNLYGPTEDTTYSTFAAIARGAEGPCPIGRPLDNKQAFLLDRYGNPVPAGVTGTLYLGGAGVARGYWDRPDLTAERFVPNPFGIPGSRMYHTGDLARLLPDGRLNYLGRSDSQIKLRGFRVELGEVEAILGALPTVRDAAVVIQPGVDGAPAMVAYLVPRDAGTDGAGDEVRQWGETFDALYDAARSEDFDFNVAGWVDSYAGRALPLIEMREWVEGTVRRIAALGARSILEIGSGTGLLLHRLAPGCARYVGTDLSRTAVDLLRAAVEAHPPDNCQVDLHHGDAADLPAAPDGGFDAVVLNSVAQYFPSCAYFAAVLAEAVDRTRDGGHVVVGDLRHLGLLRAFHTSVELFHASDDTATERLARAVAQDVEQEAELLVDPAFFFTLRKAIPRIGHVAVLAKPGHASNELTRFRYDAVLTVGPAGAAEAPRWQPWTPGALDAEVPPGGVLALRDIPDAAVAAEVIGADLLRRDGAPDVGRLRAACAAGAAGAVSRSALLVRAAALGLRATLAVGTGADGCFHAVLSRTAAAGPDGLDVDWSDLYAEAASHLARHTNRPSARQRRFTLRNALRRDLQRRLPDFLVPSRIVVLDQMPLTANGKIDRKALLAPDQAGEDRPFVAPQTVTEKVLADLWAEVLAIDRVGASDNFFDLGGHSLLATRLVARLRDAMGIGLPVRAVFETPTVAELAQRIDADRKALQDALVPPILPVPRGGSMPTSFAQQRLWVLDRLNPGNPFYNMPLALRLTGALDPDVLADTLTELARRHEVLRTSLPAVGGVPIQVIAPPARVTPNWLDLSALPPEERDARVAAEAQAEALAPFDLMAGPLLRVRLLRLAAEEHVLLFTLHHIVADGWSITILVHDVGAIYTAFREGMPSPLPELSVQYADYSAWQRSWMTSAMLDTQLAYWRGQLAGAPPLLALPTDLPRPAVQRFQGAARGFVVSADITRDLRALATRHGATLFMVLVAAYNVLLSRHAGQVDVCIGTAVANRGQGETEQLIGFFVNTLVLRLRVDPDASFASLVDQARTVTLDAYANQDLPFEQVVEALNPERHLSHAPLVQATLVLQNAPRLDLTLAGLAVRPMGGGQLVSRYDLSVNMAEEGDELRGQFEYNTDLFHAWSVARIAERFVELLAAASADPECRIGDMNPVAPAPRGLAAAEPADSPALLHRLIEARVMAAPDAAAVRFGDETTSYGLLNAQANSLARHLRIGGAGRGAVVGLHLARSIEMVVAILGVLKAGAAYLPLDPTYPRERLEYILKDSGCTTVVTKSDLPDLPGPAHTLYVDEDWPLVAIQSSGNLDVVLDTTDLAYVIYTSGSTGHPKGVGVTHAGARNLAHLATALDIGPGDRVLQFASLSFDAAVWEFVSSLTTGATLQMAPQDALMPGLTLEKTLRRHRITSVLLPPVALSTFTSANLPDLRLVISAGEALPVAVAANWATPQIRFINAYGPTETAVCVTMHELPTGSTAAPPIGRAIDNVELAVVDERGEPVPFGAIGELVVGGPGVARGYLGRPALTAERFLPNPSGPPGSRLFATGDLVRYAPDGALAYVGRADEQVKLRGFRIELGEIEATLTSFPGVRYAVAALGRDTVGQSRLVAYLVQERAVGPTNRWTEIFEQMYKDGAVPEDGSFDILGWVSSYDGRPLPASDMVEWLDQTIERIVALGPRRVLEVGCGTGLLVHRIAPLADHYLATDLSAAALARLDVSLQACGIGNVALRHCTAAELEALPTGFDTVVANSVLQYFPSRTYLEAMLDAAIACVNGRGSVFLGDVRHRGLARPFYTALELCLSTSEATVGSIGTSVARAEAGETELLLDPAYFFDLARRDMRVGSISVRIKAGRVDNELTEYRYDVVLGIGDRELPSDVPAWRNWAGLDILATWLAEELEYSVAVRGIPDARLAWPAYVARIIGEDDEATLADVQADFVVQPIHAADIRDLMALAERFGATLDLAPASGSDGLLHAAFLRGRREVDWAALYGAADDAALTNQPAAARAPLLNRTEVLRHARQMLPDYMVPNQIMILDELPLTPNGKIDRTALPAPEPAQSPRREGGESTAAEATLAEIWADLLDLDYVGPEDEFFELGGHSLLAVQLIAAVTERFGVELSLSQLFQTPTVSSLARALTSHQPERRMVGPLNAGRGGAPLFLLHPSGGDVFCYGDLVSGLPVEWEVHGVSSPEAVGLGGMPVDFGELCATYAGEIEVVAGSRPVCLAGWSLGGTLAFAVAALLEQRGREVLWVALLDTPLMEHREGQYPGIGLDAIVSWILSLPPSEIAIRYGPGFEDLKLRIAGIVQRDGIDALVDGLLNDPDRLEEALGFPKPLQEQLLAYHRAMNFGLRMTEQFTPKPIACPLHVFWAEETLRERGGADGWGRYSHAPDRGSVTVYPARHFDFVLGPNAAPLAAHLGHILQTGTGR